MTDGTADQDTTNFFNLFQQFLVSQDNINTRLAANAQDGRGKTLPVNLPDFHGRAGENVISWLFQVREIFQAREINDGQAIHYVAGSLREAALHWYQNQ